MARVILFVLFATVSLPSPAQDRILSGFVSRHSSGTHCEKNPGIGYQTGDGYAILAYRNSLCRASVAGLREFKLARAGESDLVAGAGLATGYRWVVSPVAYAALVVPVTDSLAVAAGFVPGVKDVSSSVVWAQLRYSIGR